MRLTGLKNQKFLTDDSSGNMPMFQLIVIWSIGLIVLFAIVFMYKFATPVLNYIAYIMVENGGPYVSISFIQRCYAIGMAGLAIADVIICFIMTYKIEWDQGSYDTPY